MKRLFTLLSFMCVITVANAQIVITEISYNPPESGTDSLEFIELYNAGSGSVDLEGYSFKEGVTFTFPSYQLAAGARMIVAVDSMAMVHSFSYTGALQWTSGGLSNGGEDIVIVDDQNNVLDSVDYDDVSPWPTAADGGGYSLELCNESADNSVGSNWSQSNTDAGFTLNGMDVYASPGADCTPPTKNLPFISIKELRTDSAATQLQFMTAGIVNGPDFGFRRHEIFIQSEGWGIALFKSSEISGFSPKVGDSIVVYGDLGGFNGLVQVSFDSAAVISNSNRVDTTTVSFNMLADSSYESRLIKVDGVWAFRDTSDWGTGSSGFDIWAYNANNDSFKIRIDRDMADLYNGNSFDDSFEVTGILGDYRGPQLLPRGRTDFNEIVTPPTTANIVFSRNGDVISEGDETITVHVMAQNIQANDTLRLIPLLDPSSTATSGVDFTSNADTMMFYTGMERDSFSITIIEDADIEADETVLLNFTLQVLSGSGQLSSSQYSLTITNDDLPFSNLADVVVQDNDEPRYPDTLVKVAGIVHGPTYQPGQLEFRLWDGTAAVTVFEFNNIWDYDIENGDSVHLIGRIGSYRGLVQFRLGSNPEALTLIDSNKALQSPVVVDSLYDGVESQLVRVNNLEVLNGPNSCGGDCYWVTNNGGQDSMILRFDADVPAYGTTLPATFDAIGHVTQFNDLQLSPRYAEDIIEAVGVREISNSLKVFPNPSTGLLMIRSNETIDQIRLFDLVGNEVGRYGNVQSIDISSFENGVYLLSVRAENGQMTTVKVIKK